MLVVPKHIAPQNMRNKSDSVLYSCENNAVAKNIDNAKSNTVGNWKENKFIKITVEKYLKYSNNNLTDFIGYLATHRCNFPIFLLL